MVEVHGYGRWRKEKVMGRVLGRGGWATVKHQHQHLMCDLCENCKSEDAVALFTMHYR